MLDIFRCSNSQWLSAKASGPGPGSDRNELPELALTVELRLILCPQVKQSSHLHILGVGLSSQVVPYPISAYLHLPKELFIAYSLSNRFENCSTVQRLVYIATDKNKLFRGLAGRCRLKTRGKACLWNLWKAIASSTVLLFLCGLEVEC